MTFKVVGTKQPANVPSLVDAALPLPRSAVAECLRRASTLARSGCLSSSPASVAGPSICCHVCSSLAHPGCTASRPAISCYYQVICRRSQGASRVLASHSSTDRAPRFSGLERLGSSTTALCSQCLLEPVQGVLGIECPGILYLSLAYNGRAACRDKNKGAHIRGRSLG